jgi:hypothetical protein
MAPPPEVSVVPVSPPPTILNIVDEQAVYEARREIAELKRRLENQASEPQDPERAKADPISQSNFLSCVDTSILNEKQRANHEKLLASVIRMNELRTAMINRDGANSSEMRREMNALSRSMAELYKEERQTLMELIAKNMGYNEKQSAEFAEQIKTIYDSTSPVLGEVGSIGR